MGQGNQTNLVPHRQRQQVSVGDVRRAQHLLPINGFCTQGVDLICPKHMHRVAHGLLQVRAEHLDLLAEELRLAQNALSAITGEFSSDDLLGVIFSSFCIGK